VTEGEEIEEAKETQEEAKEGILSSDEAESLFDIS
jgi:hypothetical protein